MVFRHKNTRVAPGAQQLHGVSVQQGGRLDKNRYLTLSSWVRDLKGSGCYYSLLWLSDPRASESMLKYLKPGQEKSNLRFDSNWEAVWICAKLPQLRQSSSRGWAWQETPSPSMEFLCCCEVSKEILRIVSLLFWVILNVVNSNEILVSIFSRCKARNCNTNFNPKYQAYHGACLAECPSLERSIPQDRMWSGIKYLSIWVSSASP